MNWQARASSTAMATTTPPSLSQMNAASLPTPAAMTDCGDAQMGDGAQIEPDWATDWDGTVQPAPDYEFNQRINW